jgi:hypothetical protein
MVNVPIAHHTGGTWLRFPCLYAIPKHQLQIVPIVIGRVPGYRKNLLASQGATNPLIAANIVNKSGPYRSGS